VTRDEAQTLLESYTTANLRIVELAVANEQSDDVLREAAQQLNSAYENVIAALMASSIDFTTR
jgi:hypothetical protein